MNQLHAVFVTIFSLFTASQVEAVTVSNVTYTKNSVSFNISGAINQNPLAFTLKQKQFSLRYEGDIVADGALGSFLPNTWSKSAFVARNIVDQGNSGKVSAILDGDFFYSWSEYDIGLGDATGIDDRVTVTFTQDILDLNASNPQISFIWGNGGITTPLGSLVLATVQAQAQATPVPLPAGAILLLSCFGLLNGLRLRSLYLGRAPLECSKLIPE